MSNPNRVPEGSPEGGQFAAGGAKPESSGMSLPSLSGTDERPVELAGIDPSMPDDVIERAMNSGELDLTGDSARDAEAIWAEAVRQRTFADKVEAVREAGTMTTLRDGVATDSIEVRPGQSVTVSVLSEERNALIPSEYRNSEGVYAGDQAHDLIAGKYPERTPASFHSGQADLLAQIASRHPSMATSARVSAGHLPTSHDLHDLARESDLDDRNLTGSRGVGVAMNGVSMRDTSLGNADLSHATFTNATMSALYAPETSLRSAGITRTSMREAQVTHCDLSDARLSHDDLSEASFDDSRLNGTRFDSCTMSRTSLAYTSGSVTISNSGADRLSLSGANLPDSTISASGLQNAMLATTTMPRARIDGSNLRGARVHLGDLSGSHVTGSDMSYAHVTNSDLSNTRMSDTTLAGARFEYTSLRGTTFAGCSLEGARFTDCDLDGADFENVSVGANPPTFDEVAPGSLSDETLTHLQRIGATISYRKA